MAYLEQTRKTFIRGAMLCAAGSAVLFIAIAHTRPMEWLENGSYDARVKWTARNDAPDSERVIVVDVDNDSFNQLKTTFGRWPWERKVWAGALRWVELGKPSAVAFDVLFEAQSSDPSIDQHFAEVIRESNNVVLAIASVPMKDANDGESWQRIARDALPGTSGSAQKDFAVGTPVETLASAAAGFGNISLSVGSGEVVRRVALRSNFDGKAWSSLALRAVESAAGSRVTDFGPSQITIPGGRSTALDGHGNLILRWPLRYDRDLRELSPRIRIVPFLQLKCSVRPEQCPNWKDFITPELFKDKIVLFGASAAGALDIKPMPFADFAPGFQAHAVAIDNLLRGDSVHTVPGWLTVTTIVLAAFFGAGVLILFDANWKDALAGILVIGVYTFAAFVGLRYWGVWLSLAAPLGSFGIAYIAAGAVRFATTGRELRRTRGTLDRYMAPDLVTYVLNHPSELHLEGERKELTIFFSDVRNFTTLTEGSEPQALVKQLNEYLNAMTETVFKYEGIVDKFIGDGILAHWGAFNPGKNHAELAALASLEMLDRLRELNVQWKAEGRPELAIGIGLNSGEVIFGEMGAGKKVEFTVIGDPVNLAARLESLNKEYKTAIIISEFTLAKLGPLAQTRPLGGVKVKGKTIETQIFELQGLNTGGAPLGKAAGVRSESGRSEA